jgi:hypothetical protein
MTWFKTILRFLGWTFLLFAFYYVAFLKSFLLGWGAHKTEQTNYYQGDSIVSNPDYMNTLAVIVDQPPSGIWPWIAQMGLNKGGFYTYTWLENIFGCDLHNVVVIHPEWQSPTEGEYEPVWPPQQIIECRMDNQYCCSGQSSCVQEYPGLKLEHGIIFGFHRFKDLEAHHLYAVQYA